MRPHTKSLCSTNSSGPGIEAPDHQAAQQNRRRAGAGNAQRQHRQQRGGPRRVRRRFGREHALDASRAEARRILREALGQVVAHERRRDRAAGRDAKPAADGGGTQQRYPIARQLLPYFQHDAQADRGGMTAQREPLLHGQQDLADSEQPDDRDQEIDAAQQRVPAEGHAQLTGDGIHADRGQQQAERHGDDGLVLFLAPQADERAEGQQVDGKEFRRPEAQRKARDARREKSDQEHRDQRADERRGERSGERFRSLALLRHRIAVEGGRHRPRFARNVEQDRRDRPAEQRAPIDARQHHDRGGRVHRERERQQDRDAVRPSQPRQHADEDAEQEADQHQRQRLPGQQDGETVKQERQRFHCAR